MLSHRSGIAYRLAGLVFLGLCPLLLFAQDSAPKSQTNQRTVTNPLLVNVTGCLRKNSTTGGYYVADQNGTAWELTSKKVDLGLQLFHVVRVSGHPSSRPKTQEGNSEQGQRPEAGSQRLALDVTELEMLSPSCTR